MWQIVLVLLLMAMASVYIARHFVRITRSRGLFCGGCPGCCGTAFSPAPEKCDPEKPSRCGCDGSPP